MIDAPTADQLWLVEYCEPRANDLCVTLIEAKTGKEAIDTELGTAFPVRPDQRSRVFRVTWFNYVAFLVRNESYATPDSDTPRGCGLGKLETLPFSRVCCSDDVRQRRLSRPVDPLVSHHRVALL